MNHLYFPKVSRWRLAAATALVCIAGFAAPAFAKDDITVSAFASPSKVHPGGIVQFVIEVESSGARSAPEPEHPDFGGFQILGRSVSQQMSIIGLSMNIVRKVTYQLRMDEEGEFTIPPVMVEHKGKTYSSKPVTITVDRSATQPSAQAPNIFEESHPGSRRSSGGDDEIFATMEVNDEKLWMFQHTVATFNFYRAVDLWEKPNYVKPKFEGFWVEELLDESGKQEKAYRKRIDGRDYIVSRLRYAIVPISHGKLMVDPAKVTFAVDPWSGPRSIFTKPVEITATPLPDDGKPEGFGGMVASSVKINMKTSSTSVRVDESVSVTLEVEGEGYLKPSSAPPALKGDWFDSFEPNVTDEVDKRGGVLISKRKVEFPIIPRKPGDWVIEPFNVSWFDPVLGKYNSYITAPVTIKVSPGAARMTPRSGPRKDLGQVKETIRYIKPDKQSLPEAGRLPTSQMWFWIIVLLPIPLAAGAWMYARKRDKLESDTGLQRALAAAKNAEARLAQAEKLEDPAAFAAALDQAARGYLADKWNMPAPSVTRETVIQKLDGHTDLAEGFSDLFEMVEMARYAKMDPERMSGSLQKARELIRTMERRGMER